MTEDEFQKFFFAAISCMPAKAGDDFVLFLDDNQVSFELRVSSDLLDRAERKRGEVYDSAITLFDDDEKLYWMIFRDGLLNAPNDILQTIIWHEAIHVLVHPVLSLHPNYKPIPAIHLDRIRTFQRLMIETVEFKVLKNVTPALYEEGLVEFIGLSWGCDLEGARKWVNENLKRSLGGKV